MLGIGNKREKFNLVRFNKAELNRIMEIYSKKIAIGEWKDYSICFKRNYALFCIHKSFQLAPTFEIMKNENVKFTLSSQNKIISRSNSLNVILKFLNKPYLKLIR